MYSSLKKKKMLKLKFDLTNICNLKKIIYLHYLSCFSTFLDDYTTNIRI